MAQKTAVEWLYEELWKQTDFSLPSNILEKAKEIEKQQMEEAVSTGISKADMTNNRGYFDFDKYYNQTYK